MRQDAHQLVDVQHGLPGGDVQVRHHGEHVAVLLGDLACELGIGPMTRAHSDDVAEDSFAGKHEVAHEIEDLVTHELVIETQRLLGKQGFPSDDDGGLERATFDQALLKQWGDVLVVNKGARRGDFLFVDFGRDLSRVILGVTALGSDIGAGDAEFFVRHDVEDGAIPRFLVNRLAHHEDFPCFLLLLKARFFDQLDVREGTAVHDWRLVGIHLDDGIVDAHAGQGGDDVLDGVHIHAAFGDGGGALDFLHLLGEGRDEGLVLQVDAAEFEPEVIRGRLEREGHLLTGVQGGACQRGGFCHGVLAVGGGGHSRRC